MQEQIRFTVTHPLAFAAADRPLPEGVARIYDAVLMQAGTPNGWVITPDVLAASVALWSDVPSYVNHPGFFEEPDVDKNVAIFRNARFNTNRIEAEMHMLDLAAARPMIERLDLIIRMAESGQKPPPTGLSALASINWEVEKGKRIVRAFERVWSVDVVWEPSAGGGVTAIRNSRSLEMENENNGGAVGRPAPNEAPTAPSDEMTLALQRAREEQTVAVQRAQCRQLLDMRLATANLPEGIVNLVRAHFTDVGGEVRVFSPAELDAEIVQAKAAAAALVAPASIQGNGYPAHPGRAVVTAMWSDIDRLQAAYDRMMGLAIAPELADTPRLTGIRELYHLLTGDRELRGQFVPNRVGFANATTTTLAELTRNVINKVVSMTWSNLADYRWWERVVAIRDFESLKQVSWLTVGGFGDLATIGEGVSYPELVWDDNRETSNWLKKGGYLGLTLEMIDQDDTEKWRAVPEAMAIAALRTLSASVGNIFTQAAGAGPTLSDGIALFAAGHNNLRTVALAANGTEWDAVVQAVYKQSELSSSRRLAVRPTLVIVPIELRQAAIKLFVGDREAGGTNWDVNVAGIDQKFSQDNVIVCPEFTDANDWAAMVDPRIFPSLGCGFRFGRTPEIFIAGDPNSYLMFHNDVLPVKVRYFYNVGVIDFRPVAKNNVA